MMSHDASRTLLSSPEDSSNPVHVLVNHCRLPIGITSLIWLVSMMSVFSVLGIFFPNAR